MCRHFNSHSSFKRREVCLFISPTRIVDAVQDAVFRSGSYGKVFLTKLTIWVYKILFYTRPVNSGNNIGLPWRVFFAFWWLWKLTSSGPVFLWERLGLCYTCISYQSRWSSTLENGKCCRNIVYFRKKKYHITKINIVILI